MLDRRPPMEFFTLVILAAIFWGIAPVFAKVGLVKADPLVALSIRTFVIGAILLVVCLVMGKLPSIGQLPLRDVLFIGAEGICASLLGHFAYYWALKLGNASDAVPMISAYPVITVLVAVLFLGEKMTGGKAAGMALIAAGVFLIKR